MISGGLALAAVGLGLLSRVGVDGGLPALVAGSVVISLGLAPVFGLTTELIVGSAPPAQAGAASGISETGAELGALGIAIMGSIGIAIYRGELSDRLPAPVPAEAAREAFVAGMQLSSSIAAVLGVALAILALVVLRNQPAASPEEDEDPEVATAAVSVGPADGGGR